MDLKKQMLAFIERTKTLSKPVSIDENFQYAKLRFRDSPYSSPGNRKTTKQYSKKSNPIITTNSSRASSNKSSRYNSPSRYSPNNKNFGFYQLATNTIKELLKIRSIKQSKNSEFVTKEAKIIKKLKILVTKELKGRKVVKTHSELKSYNEKIREITKQSAEELILLENKCKMIKEDNENLKKALEKTSNLTMSEPKTKTVDEILLFVSSKAVSDKILYKDPERIEEYLENIENLAQNLIKSIKIEDFNSLMSVLAENINSEKQKLEVSKKENWDMWEYEKNIRKGLENQLKNSDNQ